MTVCAPRRIQHIPKLRRALASAYVSLITLSNMSAKRRERYAPLVEAHRSLLGKHGGCAAQGAAELARSAALAVVHDAHFDDVDWL